jgi:hypothetical protein
LDPLFLKISKKSVRVTLFYRHQGEGKINRKIVSQRHVFVKKGSERGIQREFHQQEQNFIPKFKLSRRSGRRKGRASANKSQHVLGIQRRDFNSCTTDARDTTRRFQQLYSMWYRDTTQRFHQLYN